MSIEWFVKGVFVTIVAVFICYMMFDIGRMMMRSEIKSYGCDTVMKHYEPK